MMTQVTEKWVYGFGVFAMTRLYPCCPDEPSVASSTLPVHDRETGFGFGFTARDPLRYGKSR